MELLVALVALLWVYSPVCAAEGCSGFRHLENGQTFFRYGGLLVIFRCRPGYKLHGYKTNSCMSGRWSRDPPVCVGKTWKSLVTSNFTSVWIPRKYWAMLNANNIAQHAGAIEYTHKDDRGSGCSDPGPLIHGTSSMNKHGSWAVFSCNSGFQLHGSSWLYCKGLTWNSTKPVCKESGMTTSISGVNVPKPDLLQNLQATVALRTQERSHHYTLANATSEEANLTSGLLSHTPSQMSKSGKIKATTPTAHLQHYVQFPNFHATDAVRTTQLQGSDEAQGAETGSESHGSQEEAERVDESGSKSHLSPTASSTVSLVSGTAVTNSVLFTPTSPLQHTKSALPVHGSKQVLKFRETVTFQHDVTLSEGVTVSSSTVQETERGLQYPALSVEKEDPTETSTILSDPLDFISTSTSSPASSLSAPLPSFSASTSSSSTPSFTQSNMTTQLPDAPSNTSTTMEPRSHQTGHHNDTSRPPVCSYPSAPTHGNFYFHNVVNPGPGEYRYYIQYACYPGYMLAHGDIHSYCQQGDTWSGVIPVCLESTPCSGCSQLCSLSQHYNQSSNQNQTTTQCLCRAGFTLLDDGRTCRDVDECQLPAAVTGCVFGCVNSPGSFHCQCPAGYSLQSADGRCQDIDECAVSEGRGPCMDQCHNTPGSYRCSCSYGRILAGNGHSCIAECPPGYRKQPATTPENSTAQAVREECVDINECQEEACEGQCINLPGSHRCICPRGYTLHRDGRRCKDINECSQRNGGCSHLCVNQKGGYKCACPASHRLSPYSWKKCVPRPTVNTAG